MTPSRACRFVPFPMLSSDPASNLIRSSRTVAHICWNQSIRTVGDKRRFRTDNDCESCAGCSDGTRREKSYLWTVNSSTEWGADNEVLHGATAAVAYVSGLRSNWQWELVQRFPDSQDGFTQAQELAKQLTKKRAFINY